MRTLFFDQFEFDNPMTEESLEVWIAAKSDFPFPDVLSFLQSFANDEATEVVKTMSAFEEHGYGSLVRQYLTRFTGIEVPNPCEWLTYEVLNGACDWDAVFETPTMFIRFHWWSTG